MIDSKIMDLMLVHANEAMLDAMADGKVSIDDEIMTHFLKANLSSNFQILQILEAVSEQVMEDEGKIYVQFFLNKVREIANKPTEDF